MTQVAQIEQRAAEWLLRRGEVDWSRADQQAMDAWLNESMAHKAAYWRLDYGWAEADRVAALGDQRSLARPLPLVRRRVYQILAIAASIVAVCGIAILSGFPLPGRPHALTAATQVGQRGEISLSDGSKFKLNTASRARSVIAAARRDVWLDEGEAYFEVAHDRTRPFVIHAGLTTVTVLGTKFGVRRDGPRVTVAVVEGRVQIASAAPDTVNRATVIGAGDTAMTRDGALILAPRSAARVESELAWRYGMLRFDQEPLANVVAEFNRYTDRKIVVSDPKVGAIRIGGAFHANNSRVFLRLLHDAYGLRVEQDGDTTRISD